jgi:hypothetical protein
MMEANSAAAGPNIEENLMSQATSPQRVMFY